MSANLYNNIVTATVEDWVHNASDHRPLSIVLRLSGVNPVGVFSYSKRDVKVYRYRWDKANLQDYYATSYECLSNIPLLSYNCVETSDTYIAEIVNNQYNYIVYALQNAASMSVPRIPVNSLHHFWYDELDDLKSKSIFWHNLWKTNGCPRSGTVHLIKCQTALRYKHAIKLAIERFDSQFDEDIIENFSSKDFPEFWKFGNRNVLGIRRRMLKLVVLIMTRILPMVLPSTFKLCILILPQLMRLKRILTLNTMLCHLMNMPVCLWISLMLYW